MSLPPGGRLSGISRQSALATALVASIGELARSLIVLDGADESFGHFRFSTDFDRRRGGHSALGGRGGRRPVSRVSLFGAPRPYLPQQLPRERLRSLGQKRRPGSFVARQESLQLQHPDAVPSSELVIDPSSQRVDFSCDA